MHLSGSQCPESNRDMLICSQLRGHSATLAPVSFTIVNFPIIVTIVNIYRFGHRQDFPVPDFTSLVPWISQMAVVSRVSANLLQTR